MAGLQNILVQNLYLANNEIEVLKILNYNICKVHARNNKITSIEIGENCYYLTYLNLRENQIADLDSFMKVLVGQYFYNLEKVNLLANPVVEEKGDSFK